MYPLKSVILEAEFFLFLPIRPCNICSKPSTYSSPLVLGQRESMIRTTKAGKRPFYGKEQTESINSDSDSHLLTNTFTLLSLKTYSALMCSFYGVLWTEKERRWTWHGKNRALVFPTTSSVQCLFLLYFPTTSSVQYLFLYFSFHNITAWNVHRSSVLWTCQCLFPLFSEYNQEAISLPLLFCFSKW